MFNPIEVFRQHIDEALHPRLPFDSFLSEFFQTGPSRVTKMGRQQDLYGGIVALSQPAFRKQLMLDEFAALKRLSPFLNPRLVGISRNDYPDDELAIEMDIIPPSNLLLTRLHDGVDQPIPAEYFPNLADLISSYHSDSSLCPTVPGVNLAKHHLDKTVLEIGFNQEVLQSEGAPPAIFDNWRRLAEQYFNRHRELINSRQELLGEPHLALGDAKLDNCGILDGHPFLFDPIAPAAGWRVLDRFMDAYLIHAGLLVMGKNQEAQSFWQRYIQDYNMNIGLGTFSREEQIQIEKSNCVMERIAHLQRLGLLVSVAAHHKDINTTRQAFNHLDQAYAVLGTELSS